MTSTSELFHSRRHRFNLSHNNAPDVTGFYSSNNYHQHRTIIRRHATHHYARQSNRRRLHLSEHDEQGGSHSPLGSFSIINSDDFRDRGSRSNRLPGAVLLARERLVERLRGVSVSGYRQSSGPSPSMTRQDDFSFSTNYSLIGTDSDPSVFRNERMEEMPTRKHPPGLSRDALNCLPSEVFSNENDDETSRASRECTFCLEDFHDGGDELIRLHCAHTFHSFCLFPWVQKCGACPNCRKPIFVNVPIK